MPQFRSVCPQWLFASALMCAASTVTHTGCTPQHEPANTASRAQHSAQATPESRAPWATLASSAAGRSSVESANSVHFSLDSSSATLALDGKLLLLARFVIPRDAHIYWHNPGESGRATLVHFNAPPGSQVAPLQYPGPQRFRGERGSTSYGYAGTVTLVSEVVLPLPPRDRVEFTAEAEWLACSSVCAIERATARVSVEPAVNSVQAPEATQRPAAESNAAKPPYSQLPLPWPHTAVAPERTGPSRWRLRAPAGAKLIEFFPYAPLLPDERDCTSLASDGGRELNVESNIVWAGPAKGVVRALLESGETRYFEVELP